MILIKIGLIFPSFYPVNDALPLFYNGLETRDYWLAKYLDKFYEVVIVGPQDSKIRDFKGKIVGTTPCVGTNPLMPIQLEYLSIQKNKKELKDCDIIHDDTHFKQSYKFKKYFNKSTLCFTWDHHPDNLKSFPQLDPNIICISKWQEKTIKEKFNWANTYLIYPGLNVDFYKQFYKKIPNNEKIYHVFLSRLSSIKGPHLVLELAKQYKDEQFIILGDVLFTQENFYAWALKVESEKLDNLHIIFNASFKEKIHYLNYAKSYLHLALWEEPFGLTMIEGLYFNAPIYALANDYKKGGVNEILIGDFNKEGISNTEVGLKVKINRNDYSNILKNCIEKFKIFLNCINTYKDLQNYVIKNFNINITLEQYKKYFNKLYNQTCLL